MERKIRCQACLSERMIRDLIRKDLQARAIEQVDQLLLEGLNSPAEPSDEKWLKSLKAGLKKPPRRPRA
jgi:hypothetical protein